ncbi:CMRF35-like molecule 6 isoform X1 [Sinocyclocheilus grahami]|uniref:CMRF35-like molecule 6 isoform X1 n=1 Tax=Sinocyclocheilus grahami TaxID=75366 RepID=UPI0007AC9909|nr:PREDICTED: CMRF35-like molecule 6 isoform X1 [Sinocyclocheilus grahami]
MKLLYVLGIWICLSVTDGADIHGYSGKGVTITCSHGLASTNIKYFCREPCEDKDVLVKSDQSPRGRYTLKDHGAGTFTVSITDLQESDSGIYWCAVDRSVKDTYKEVKLTVSKALDTNRPTTPKPAASSQSSMTQSSFSTSSASADTTTSSSTGFKGPVVSSKPASNESGAQYSLSSGPLMITAIGLTVMVIIFGAVLCLWNKQRKNSPSSNVDAEIQGTTHSTETAGDYEAITETQQRTEAHTGITIYSTVNKSTEANQIQDPPLYSTLSV